MLFDERGWLSGFSAGAAGGSCQSGRLTKMSTSADPVWNYRWLRYDDGPVELRFKETRIPNRAKGRDRPAAGMLANQDQPRQDGHRRAVLASTEMLVQAGRSPARTGVSPVGGDERLITAKELIAESHEPTAAAMWAFEEFLAAQVDPFQERRWRRSIDRGLARRLFFHFSIHASGLTLEPIGASCCGSSSGTDTSHGQLPIVGHRLTETPSQIRVQPVGLQRGR